MSILRFVFCNYLKMSISILLFSVYFGSQHLNAEQFNATYSRNFKDYKEQSNLLSPIHFLTDREVINRKINKTFLDSGLESDLLTAKENLDKLQSNQWILTESQANFFQNLLNSRHLIRPHLVKYINNCKKLLKKWSLNNQQKLARYFFHAFHLLLNPPSHRAQKNILFNNSPPKSGDLAFGFLSFINQMYFQLDSTLKIYFYQLNQPQIIDSIQKLAYWIGPHRIKIILEEDYLHKDKLRGDPSDYSTALRKLLNAGIRIRTDKSYRSNGNGESHHKFAIIEPDQIFTGSWNPTSRGTNRNFNHAFWLQSKKLLKLYDHEFEQIWQGKSQSHKSSHWDYRWINIKGGRARVFFSPQDPLKDVIINSLQQAKFKIVIALFFLTDPDIIDLLRLKRSTGVTVKIVIDNLGIGSRVAKKKESLSQLLKIYKLEHWKDDGAGHWHHKAAVIDKKVVLSGSANWSQSAFTKNDENLLQMEHPELAIKLEKILEAKKSFIYWNPNSTIMTQNLIIPKYWRLTRQKDSLRVQLPSNAGEWQVRVNKVPIKTKISKLNTIDFIDHTFFNSKKDQFLDLYHPKFKRLHSLFLSNQDNSLSKKSILLIKSSLIRNPLSGCLSGNPTDENCLESKIKFNGCRQASVDNLKAGFWKNCDNITRID